MGVRGSGEQPRRSPLRVVALVGAAVLASKLLPQQLGFAAGAPRAGGPPRAAARGGLARRAAGIAVDTKAEAKAKLLDLLSDATVQQEVLRQEGKPIRGQLDEMITVLERLNPTSEPAYSEQLDGVWQVKYSGSYAPGLLSSPTRELALFLYGGGFSLGSALTSFAEGFWGQNLGLKLGSKTVRIQGGRDVDATAEIDFAGQQQTLSYTAELLPLSSRRLNEEVVGFDLPGPIGKQDAPFELRRSILITYLDEEVLIVRDESGVPEVLVRTEGWTAGATPAANETATEAAPSEDSVAQDPMSADAA